MGGKRNVGQGAAKRIEQQLSLPDGWMDRNNPSGDEPAALSAAHRPTNSLQPDPKVRLSIFAGLEQEVGSDDVLLDPVMKYVVDQLESRGKTHENILPNGLIFSALGDFRVDILVDDLAIDIFHVSSTNEVAVIDRALARSLKLKHATPRLRYIVILCPAKGQPTSPTDRWTSVSAPRLASIFEAAKDEIDGFKILPTAQDYASIDGLIEIALH
jgi:hypothetical protein